MGFDSRPPRESSKEDAIIVDIIIRHPQSLLSQYIEWFIFPRWTYQFYFSENILCSFGPIPYILVGLRDLCRLSLHFVGILNWDFKSCSEAWGLPLV